MAVDNLQILDIIEVLEGFLQAFVKLVEDDTYHCFWG